MFILAQSKWMPILIFMNKLFSYPKFKYGNNPCVVYKMSFDTGYFYIGSSKKFKVRIGVWIGQIKRNAVLMKVIKSELPKVKKVTFEIIEYTTSENRLQRETFHLELHKDNPFLMNRCPTAFSPKGLRPLPLHLRKPVKEKGVSTPPKPVNRYSLSGEFLGCYPSINKAAADIGVNPSTIQDHLKSKRKKGVRGFVFKLCEDHSPVEIIKRKIIERKPHTRWRKVVNTLTGEIFENSAIVAKKENMKNATYFWKRLNGDKPNPTPYRFV